MSIETVANANPNRVDSSPTLVTGPRASPNPITAATTNLSVLGDDASGESALTYTWSPLALPGGASPPTFSANGTNAAKNTIATFSQAGVYTINVAISDGTL